MSYWSHSRCFSLNLKLLTASHWHCPVLRLHIWYLHVPHNGNGTAPPLSCTIVTIVALQSRSGGRGAKHTACCWFPPAHGHQLTDEGGRAALHDPGHRVCCYAGHGTDKGNCVSVSEVSRASPHHDTIAQHLQVSHPDTRHTRPHHPTPEWSRECVSVQTTTGKLSVSKLT